KTLGLSTAFLAVFLPLYIASAVGTYLFYVQHNFPGAKYQEEGQWDYVFAALHTSSMFDMNSVMAWFTGNIGYHHVHHINHLIPFYRPPEAMAAMPELQNPGRTSWSLREMIRCLSLELWDSRLQRMVSVRELRRLDPSFPV